MIKGSLTQWEAFNKPRIEMTPAYQEGSRQISQGLRSWPTVARLWGDDGYMKYDPTSELNLRDAEVMVTKVYLRAMKDGVPPMHFDTHDLVSPIDGLPVRFSFDGSAIVIDAGTSGDRKTKETVPAHLTPLK